MWARYSVPRPYLTHAPHPSLFSNNGPADPDRSVDGSVINFAAKGGTSLSEACVGYSTLQVPYVRVEGGCTSS